MTATAEQKGHSVAFWAAATTFFANVAALNLLSLFADESEPHWQAVAALATALVVAASVYTKARWDEERRKQGQPPAAMPPVGTTYMGPAAREDPPPPPERL